MCACLQCCSKFAAADQTSLNRDFNRNLFYTFITNITLGGRLGVTLISVYLEFGYRPSQQIILPFRLRAYHEGFHM